MVAGPQSSRHWFQALLLKEGVKSAILQEVIFKEEVGTCQKSESWMYEDSC